MELTMELFDYSHSVLGEADRGCHTWLIGPLPAIEWQVRCSWLVSGNLSVVEIRGGREYITQSVGVIPSNSTACANIDIRYGNYTLCKL